MEKIILLWLLFSKDICVVYLFRHLMVSLRNFCHFYCSIVFVTVNHLFNRERCLVDFPFVFHHLHHFLKDMSEFLEWWLRDFRLIFLSECQNLDVIRISFAITQFVSYNAHLWIYEVLLFCYITTVQENDFDPETTFAFIANEEFRNDGLLVFIL